MAVIIKIDPHTIERMGKRGVFEAEILDTLNNGTPFQAKHGRKGKFTILPYEKEYEGKYYPEKRIEVIFVEEENTITTVTVYAYYGKWEK